MQGKEGPRHCKERGLHEQHCISSGLEYDLSIPEICECKKMPDYALHSLGWNAFQQLCGTILREIWGQTFQVFADVNDAGRDGAFFGSWKSKRGGTFSGSTTVQCKFSAQVGKSLSPADLSEEFLKAKSLAEKGLADNYVLITNCKITASMESEISQRFQKISGIKKCACYGKEWICATIAENVHLRTLVPRLYGLGDLTQILDERAHRQARAILSSMDDELGKFVVTDAHQQSIEALNSHRFVLLLGEPACGKSTIASALALAAADRWGSQLVRVDSPEQFRAHWNPSEPRQFFWVDDAFGQTQYERPRALAWNHAFPALEAAIHKGASAVFTSRDYIYRAALDDLKEDAFTLLREGQVVIEVQKLSLKEKEQILYNHIKLGSQPAQFRNKLKEFLPEVAQSNHFLPEIARRLGNPFFTKDLTLDQDSVVSFVEQPEQFLRDVTKRLDASSRAALGMVFMRGGKLPSLRKLGPEESHALLLLNTTLGGVREALKSLKGTLVIQTQEEGEYLWRFKHPTIRDAYGALVSDEPDLIDIYIAGTKVESLLTEITCGQMKIKGVKLVVPEEQWPKVVNRISELDLEDAEQAEILYDFLANRCHARFLKYFLEQHPDFICSLKYQSWMRYDSAVNVITRFHSCRLLPADERERFVEEAKWLAIRTPDADFLAVPKIRALFRKAEIKTIMDSVVQKLGPKLRSKIAELRRDCIKEGADPDQYFWLFQRAVTVFGMNLPDDWKIRRRFYKASRQIRRHIETLKKKRRRMEKIDIEEKVEEPRLSKTRSIFEDVDVT